MKKKLLIIVVLLLAFAIFLGVKFFVFGKDNITGRIRIVSSPSAGVFIDNVAVGKTPHEATLKPGEYHLKLIPDGQNTKTVSWEGTVTVYESALTYVSRELGTSDLTSAGEILTISTMKQKSEGNTGEIVIETNPTGGIVYLDSDQKGIAPLQLENVAVGDHEISVYLPGFFRRSQKINVEKAHVLKAQFKLALDKSHKTLEEELLEKQREASEEAKKKAASDEAKAKEEKEAKETEETPTSDKTLKILETPTGFLNVRSEASTNGEIVTTVNPGNEYDYTEEENGWYKITLSDGRNGWVSGEYVEVQ